MIAYCQIQKTVNTWKISGMLIVYWPITIKFRIRKLTSKPQTNYRCSLRFSYLAPYWLISRNTITFHKYFWCSRFCEFHSNWNCQVIMINRRADRRPTVLTGCQKSTNDLVLMLKLFTFIVSWRNNLIGLTLDIAGGEQRVSRKNIRGGSGLGERGKKSSSSFLCPSSFFPPFPLRFVKLRYEKLFLSCNGRKTLVNSKYQLKRANLHLVFIGFQSNYSFLTYVIWRQKRDSGKRWKKWGMWDFRDKGVGALPDPDDSV